MSWASDIDAAGASVRLSRSEVGADDNVVQSPASLLEQARRIAGDVSLDRYSLARIMASEFGKGHPEELLAIGDADLNRAKAQGRSVFDHCTGGTGRYGRQGGKRPVATSQDPYVRQLRAANLLLDTSAGARGIARTATMYFDPKTQLALWERGSAAHPLVILDRWTYARAWKGSIRRDDKGRQIRELGDVGTSGDPQREWIGNVDGIRGWWLMLFRVRTSVESQRRNYEAARALISSGGRSTDVVGDDLVSALAPAVLLAAAKAIS